MTSGQHFLHTPGPTTVPVEVQNAIAAPLIDHRGPAFKTLFTNVLQGLERLFRTSDQIVVYPSSGTGAWEAALVNVASPGDLLLAFDIGHFALTWSRVAERLGMRVDLVNGDWRSGVAPELVLERLSADAAHTIKAVLVVHNETSTGAVSPILRSGEPSTAPSIPLSC